MKRRLISGKKIFSSYLFALLFLTALFASENFGQKTSSNYYAHLKPAHAAAIKSYLSGRTNIRPAQVSDCKNIYGLDSFYQSEGRKKHPFYAIKDFNQDKIEDFAVVLYDSKRRADSRFTVLIFNGVKAEGDFELAYQTAYTDLRLGGIWTYGAGTNETKITVTAGVFETDDCLWIEWNGKKYLEYACGEPEN